MKFANSMGLFLMLLVEIDIYFYYLPLYTPAPPALC